MTNKKDKITKATNIIILILCASIIFFISFNSCQFLHYYSETVKEIIINKQDAKEVFNKRDKDFSENFYNKYLFLEYYGAYAKILDQKQLNNIYKAENDILVSPSASKIESTVLENNIEQLVKLSETLKSLNIPFLFIRLPIVFDNENLKLPPGIYDCKSLVAKDFADLMAKNNLEYYDFSYITKNGKPEEQYFYTDHHWRPEFAYKAVLEEIKLIQNKLDIDVDSKVLNFNNYNIETVKQKFLGSYGRRTGFIYSGFDDINIITPNFDTFFEGTLNFKQISGTFEDVFIHRKHVGENIYYSNAYSLYSNGLKNMHIINKNAKNRTKVLILADSYTCAMAPFLSNALYDVMVVDLRAPLPTNASVIENENYSFINTVKAEKPDIVIIQYYGAGLSMDTMFSKIN